MNTTAPQPDPPSPAPDSGADHEDFVRGIDRQFGRAYSLSGLVVIAAVALFAGLAVALFGTETLRMARLWIGVVLVFLVSLFVIRIFVARRAFELLAKIQRYCQDHGLHVEAFRAAHTQNGAYQYFQSVFEVTQRRKPAGGAPTHAVGEADPAETPEIAETPETADQADPREPRP